jgi:hypothetical protein
MPDTQDPWELTDDAGNLIEKFKYFDIEFLFDTAEEATQISEIVASIVSDFGSEIRNAELVLDTDDTEAPAGASGGVAHYLIYPNSRGMAEAFQTQLAPFNVDITIWPSRGI